jgi:hypothetical protein
MSHVGLADLLGVRTKSIRWERPQLFFAALFISDLSWLLFQPAYRWLVSVVSGASSYFQFPQPMDWLGAILVNLLLVALAVLAFRLLPYSILAMVATVIVYAPLARVISYIMYYLSIPTDSTYSPSLSSYFTIQEILLPALWSFLFLGGLALAARLIEPLWLALPVGTLSGSMAHFTISLIIDQIRYGRLYTGLAEQFTRVLPFRLLDALLLALVLWVGLSLTAGKDLSSEPGKERLPKSFYLGATMSSLGVSLVLIGSALSSLILRACGSESIHPPDFIRGSGLAFRLRRPPGFNLQDVESHPGRIRANHAR